MDDRKVTVAVCGDSFCAASINDLQVTGTGYRAHFSQMLEDVYGYQVMHFAHGGFSNVAILFQIKTALEHQADVVVYNRTWSNRLELYKTEKFFLGNGSENFFYYDPNYESSHQPWAGDRHSAVISTTHHSITQSPFFDITKEQALAVDLYLKYLYNDNAKTAVDTWLFEYWHNKIQQQGSIAICFNDADVGRCAYEFSAANPSFDTPFHTDRATQEQIAANIHRCIVDKSHTSA